jgi:hypothetical protein
VLLDAACDVFTIKILARHDNDAAASPVVGSGENPAMPEGKNGSLSLLIDLVEMLVTFALPAKGFPDHPNETGRHVRNSADLNLLPNRKPAWLTPRGTSAVCVFNQTFGVR